MVSDFAAAARAGTLAGCVLDEEYCLRHGTAVVDGVREVGFAVARCADASEANARERLERELGCELAEGACERHQSDLIDGVCPPALDALKAWRGR